MGNTQLNLKDKLQFGLSDRLAKALDVAGMSNQEMADCLGVSRNTISNYTHGNSSPRKLYMREWAMRTGVPLEWLETGSFPNEESPHTAGPNGGKKVGPEVLETPTLSV
ncbi:helix-turn-helix transcriptional regulator [Leucobacter sp. NPDC077196]|uniref:helix-turn-helix domain-containing protein n=1 Tax=Leucobacter sp. NPDC077196 TaxID=3154959 RepID=UPI00341F6E45